MHIPPPGIKMGQLVKDGVEGNWMVSRSLATIKNSLKFLRIDDMIRITAWGSIGIFGAWQTICSLVT
jgi:hypothetical protein